MRNSIKFGDDSQSWQGLWRRPRPGSGDRCGDATEVLSIKRCPAGALKPRAGWHLTSGTGPQHWSAASRRANE
jgi:hypothetical protein